MSVHSKMTVVADKIRSLLGLTGAMGLDAMAANLDTAKANLSNAFAAIGDKGGTVPPSKVSGNLETAIRSIPDYVPVQKAEGSVTISYDSEYNTYIDCGFTPDVVLIKDLLYTNGSGVQTEYQLAAVFAEQKSGRHYLFEGYIGTETSWKKFSLEMYPTASGFRLYNAYYYDQSNNWHYGTGEVLNYVAVKYTA